MGHKWVNVFYVQLTHTNPVTVNDLKTLADYVAAHHVVAGSSSISSTTTLTQVDVNFIPSAGNSLDYTGTYSAAGAGGTQVADASACQVITWIISDRYRGGHPSSYIPGLLAGSVANGSDISAGVVSALVAGMDALRTGINALTSTNITAMVMGTVRYESGNAWLSPPVFRAYTSTKGRNKLGSQRRRILS